MIWIGECLRIFIGFLGGCSGANNHAGRRPNKLRLERRLSSREQVTLRLVVRRVRLVGLPILLIRMDIRIRGLRGLLRLECMGFVYQ